MTITSALKIEGWMTVPELVWLAGQAQTHYKIAEVGSYLGRSTRAIVDNTTGLTVAVDSWHGDHHIGIVPDDRLLVRFNREFANEVVSGRLKVWEVDHGKVSFSNGEHFDMVFIDGSHDYDSVLRDINIWLPVVDKGGIICGHDFNEEHKDGVIRAVLETWPDIKVVDNTSIWYRVME